MKKILLSLLVCLMAVTAVACSSDSANGGKIEGSLEEIMDRVYEGAGIDNSEYMVAPIMDEMVEYHLGTSEVEYEESLVSQALILTDAHEVVLLRVDEDTDIEATKAAIKENVDPMKWICVGVDDDQVIVDNVGDVVILIMDENAEELHEAFLSLAE